MDGRAGDLWARYALLRAFPCRFRPAGFLVRRVGASRNAILSKTFPSTMFPQDFCCVGRTFRGALTSVARRKG